MKKTCQYHHCKILDKHNPLNFECFVYFEIHPECCTSSLRELCDTELRILSTSNQVNNQGKMQNPTRQNHIWKVVLLFCRDKTMEQSPNSSNNHYDFQAFSRLAKVWLLTQQTCTHLKNCVVLVGQGYIYDQICNVVLYINFFILCIYIIESCYLFNV